VISFDDVVQILDLPVLCVLRALAFGLQLGESGGIGRRFVGVDDLRLFPFLFSPLRTLARKRFAAIVFRVGEIEVDRVAQLVDSSVEVSGAAPKLILAGKGSGNGSCRPPK
jgi:hypothetical protein